MEEEKGLSCHLGRGRGPYSVITGQLLGPTGGAGETSEHCSVGFSSHIQQPVCRMKCTE